MTLSRLLVLFSLFSLAFSLENIDSHLFPRPLIAERIDGSEIRQSEELGLQCTSWRFSVETNNRIEWKKIPEECLDYVKDYMTGLGYGLDLERVCDESEDYAKSVELVGDERDAWIFDVDETLLSNIPYYAHHGYGSEIFNPTEFNKWVEKSIAPAIESSLKLYKQILSLGFKVILLTGRGESLRHVTVDNLINAGFQDWHKLILRAADEHEKTATEYKSEKRSEMEREGYRIHGNSGDQWSDLLGAPMSARSFKLPNPMYYIP